MKSVTINKILNTDNNLPRTVGFHVLFCAETKFTRYGKSLADLLGKYPLNPNLTYYTSYNTFDKFKHSDGNVLGLNALWLDFDCVNNNIPVRIFRSVLPKLIDLMGLPNPNHCIMSGNGFHLVYFFSQPRVTHSKRFTYLWIKLEQYIIKIGQKACLNLFSNPNICDDTVYNPSRLMRITGSYNNKHNKHILVRRVPELENKGLYSMQYYIDNYMPEYKQPTFKKQKRTHKQFNHYLKKHKKYQGSHTVGTLNYCRYYDLKSLVEMRNGKCTGYRDFILFTIACQLAYVMKANNIIKYVESVNDMFSQPLPKEQMKDFTNEIKHIDFRNYKLHTNMYLIMKLGITSDEQDGLLTIKEAKKSTDIQHHLNHIKRTKYLKIRNKKVVKLHNDGLSNRKISKIMKVSKDTINRVVKSSYYIKQGGSNLTFKIRVSVLMVEDLLEIFRKLLEFDAREYKNDGIKQGSLVDLKHYSVCKDGLDVQNRDRSDVKMTYINDTR